MKFRPIALALVLSLLAAASVQAAEPGTCKKPHIADVGWSDNTAINGLFTTVLKGLGYTPKVSTLALPVILESLKTKNLDIFLDNLMPSNAANVTPYLEAKTVEQLPPNLLDANYAPVVPDYVAAAGVKAVGDLARYGEKFGKKFYGIEPGNDGNKIVQAALDNPATGMKGWKLIESSEQGMLAEAQKKISRKEWVVFLGWTPHPVMGLMPLTYLDGWEGFGATQIHTLTRPGYSSECANLGKLLQNLEFTLTMESQVMAAIDADPNKNGEKAGAAWLKKNPAVLEKWLAGVMRFDGQDGLSAVKTSLGL